MKVQILPFSITLFLAILLGIGSIFADSIERVGACATPGVTWGVYVQDTFAYIADRGHISIVSISDPSSPWVTGTTTEVWALGIHVKDTIAYLNSIGLQNRFETASVRDPAFPCRLGWCYVFLGGMGNPTGIVLKDTIIYLATGQPGGVMQINVSDPSQPDTIKAYYTPGVAVDLAMKDTLLYIADITSVQIINVADPLNPLFVGSVPMSSSCEGIFVVDTFAFATWVGGEYGSLKVINISNPASPQIVASLDNLKGDPIDVWVQGNYAYVAAADFWYPAKAKERQIAGMRPEWAFNERADEEGGLRVVDISNPLEPILVGSYDTPGDPSGVFAVDTLVFIADKESLQILRHVITGIEETSKKVNIKNIELHVYPNPFSHTTSISFYLPISSRVSLEVFDITGKHIKTFYHSYRNAGKYEASWNVNNKDGDRIAGGIYFFRLTTHSETLCKKILVLK
ncbi:T9SS type A sorting domain-containing protein [candidate division WOR-3 bacterium]|nr:T9SS type A sorting domain-containing protein [candidate division WOR-3 bacterium]